MPRIRFRALKCPQVCLKWEFRAINPAFGRELVRSFGGSGYYSAWLSVGFPEKMEERAEIIRDNFRHVRQLEEELFR